MAEQLVVFEGGFRKNPEEFEAFLVFDLIDREGEHFEQEVVVTCGEDIVRYMKSFFKEDWADLLSENMEHIHVRDGTFEGIHLKGKNEKGRFSTHMLNDYMRSTFVVNEKVVKDINKEKLLQIREIILS